MNNLYRKLYEIMGETKAIDKDMTIEFKSTKYSAISESNILNEIKPLLKKYKIIILPIDVNMTQSGTLTSMVVKWKIVDVESGEWEVLSSPGNGADSQDKGSGKAFTYSYKALWQKLFMLFSGEDSDNDFSDDITKSQTRQPKQSHKPEPSGKADALAELAKMKGQDLGEIKTMIIKKYNKANISDLTDAEIEPIMKWLRRL